MSAVEPEINAGRRAFPVTQELLAGSPVNADEVQTLECGWHDTSVSAESGAFALVAAGAGLDGLIGEIVQVSAGERSVFVYVLATASLPTAFSLARRAWMAIANPSIESLACDVVVVA